jgi:hypothetical protein
VTRRIKLVLDSTAVASFALDDSPDVGETIEQIVDEGAGFAIPLLCLAEVATSVKADGLPLLRVLADHPHGAVVPVPEDWETLALEGRVYGSLQCASAVLVARSHRGAYVLTKDSVTYGALPTIPLDDDPDAT